MLSLLNAVELFGKTFENCNASVAKGLLITAIVILSVATVVLLIKLIKLLSGNRKQRAEQTVAQTTTPNEKVYYTPKQNTEDEQSPAPQVKTPPRAVVDQQPVAVTVAEPAVVEPAVTKPVIVEPVIIEEESVQAGKLRYDRSFTARYIQSEDKTKAWYTEIKNDLLSYKKVSDRISWKRETFRWHRESVAKLVFRGKTLCLYLPLKVADYVDKYHVEDASDSVSYADTPLLLRIKSYRRVKYAKFLISQVMSQRGITRLAQQQSIDYYMPYEGLVQLINKGLIKRVITNNKQEAFFTHKNVDTETKGNL